MLAVELAAEVPADPAVAGPHFSAAAEKPINAAHAPRHRATYRGVSPIFGNAPEN